MAITQVRGSSQILNKSVTLNKLADDFVLGQTWNLSTANDAILTGLSNTPTLPNQAVTKAYVDALIDTTLKSPDSFSTTAGAAYPSNYKGTGAVAEGDTFYVTSIALGALVGTQQVNVGDLLVARVDAPANVDANWIVMESNRDQATMTVPGVARIATGLEASTGTDNTTIITPLTLAAAVGAGVTAANGLNKLGTAIRLGGSLTEETTVDLNNDILNLRYLGTGIRLNGINGAEAVEIHSDQPGATLSISNQANELTMNQTTGLVSLYADNRFFASSSATSLDLLGSSGTVTLSAGAASLSLDNTGTAFVLNAGGGEVRYNGTDLSFSNMGTLSYLNGNGDFGMSSGVASITHDVGASTLGIYGGPNAISLDYANGTASLVSGGSSFIATAGTGELLLDAGADLSLLASQPSGTVPLAIATTGYVDGLVGGLTADNGLTKTGSNIALGGALTANTSVTGAGTYSLDFTGLTSSNIQTPTVYGGTNFLRLNETGFTLESNYDASNTIGFRILGESGNGVIFTSLNDTDLITYAADYSANFTPRTLVDRQYVDNIFAGLGFANGIYADTAGDGNIKLGGNLTEPTNIRVGGVGFGHTFDLKGGSTVNLSVYTSSSHNDDSIEMGSGGGANLKFYRYNGSAGYVTFDLGRAEWNIPNGNGRVLIYDNRNAGTREGLTYAGDYSADFVARSLVDKGYVDGISKTAGAGLTDTAGTFDVVAADASLLVNADNMQVQVGTTNGNSLEVTATGIELGTSITGARTIDSTINTFKLTNTPDGTDVKAVANVEYVKSVTGTGTEVYNELPTVTGGAATVTIAHAPTAGTLRVYTNGLRMAPGAANDYILAGTTITFSDALLASDVVVVDYKY